jgi:hypothetical protein
VARAVDEFDWRLTAIPLLLELLDLIRQHWSIESQLHWVLDVTFITTARMTQIMALLNLALDLQEEILFLPLTCRGHDVIKESDVNLLVDTFGLAGAAAAMAAGFAEAKEAWTDACESLQVHFPHKNFKPHFAQWLRSM